MLSLDLVEVGGEQIEVRVHRGHPIIGVQQVLHLRLHVLVKSTYGAVEFDFNACLAASPPPQ